MECGGHAAAVFFRDGHAVAQHRGMAAMHNISGGMAAALIT